MKCRHIQKMLSCYVDGELDEASRQTLDEHLFDCAKCSSELKALRLISGKAACIEEIDPPLGLEAAILASTEMIRQKGACREVCSYLSECIDGELEPETARTVEEHVSHCQSCESEFEMLSRSVSAMTALDEVEPPQDLRGRILAHTTRSEAAGSLAYAGNLIHPLKIRRLGWAAAGLAAASAIAVIIAGSAPELDRPVAALKPVQMVETQKPGLHEQASLARSQLLSKPVKAAKATEQIASAEEQKKTIEPSPLPARSRFERRRVRQTASERKMYGLAMTRKHPAPFQTASSKRSDKAKPEGTAAQTVKMIDVQEGSEQPAAMENGVEKNGNEKASSFMKIAIVRSDPQKELHEWAQSMDKEVEQKKLEKQSSTITLIGKRF